MENTGLMLVFLIILCCVSLVIAIISLIVVSMVLKKQKEIIKICNSQNANAQMAYQQSAARTQQSNIVRSKEQNVEQYGTVICKQCYAAIRENSTVCPNCNTPIHRR